MLVAVVALCGSVAALGAVQLARASEHGVPAAVTAEPDRGGTDRPAGPCTAAQLARAGTATGGAHTRDRPLVDLVPAQPPGVWSLVDDGRRSVDEAALSRRDNQARDRLVEHAFEGGWTRTWSDPAGLTSHMYLYRFATDADAAAFNRYTTSYACGLADSTFEVPGVPGAVGMHIGWDDGTVAAQATVVVGDIQALVQRRWQPDRAVGAHDQPRGREAQADVAERTRSLVASLASGDGSAATPTLPGSQQATTGPCAALDRGDVDVLAGVRVGRIGVEPRRQDQPGWQHCTYRVDPDAPARGVMVVAVGPDRDGDQGDPKAGDDAAADLPGADGVTVARGAGSVEVRWTTAGAQHVVVVTGRDGRFGDAPVDDAWLRALIDRAR